MWNKFWLWLGEKYETNPVFHGAVAAAEGGAVAGLGTWITAGAPLTKQGLAAALAGVGGGAGIALRNYFKNRLTQPATGAPKA